MVQGTPGAKLVEVAADLLTIQLAAEASRANEQVENAWQQTEGDGRGVRHEVWGMQARVVESWTPYTHRDVPEALQHAEGLPLLEPA